MEDKIVAHNTRIWFENNGYKNTVKRFWKLDDKRNRVLMAKKMLLFRLKIDPAFIYELNEDLLIKLYFRVRKYKADIKIDRLAKTIAGKIRPYILVE